MLPVHFVSAPSLEEWNWRTPASTGIGASEGSHVEMAQRTAKRGYDVRSWSPAKEASTDPCGVPWTCSAGLDLASLGPGVVINYRAPQLFDCPKPPGQVWWFVAQDTDYPGLWTEQALHNVDRYLTLCEEHTKYTWHRYPALRKKLFKTTNGVRTDFIEGLEKKGVPARMPYRLLYASSPDRGLDLLLRQWFRVKERYPEATLHVAYGFNNMETIVRLMGGNDWRAGFQKELEGLLRQEGVTFTGRLNTEGIHREFFEASVWSYPSDWPETSCATASEAQACGAIPVTNNFWAVGENVQWGYMVDGVPQKSDRVKHLWLANLYDALEKTASGELDEDSYHRNPTLGISYRREMMSWSRRNFDYERVVDQWTKWLDVDLKAAEASANTTFSCGAD